MPTGSKPENNGDAPMNPVSSGMEEEPCESDCRTRGLTADVSECSLHRPRCKYAYSFGYAFFCTHPRHREFRKKS